MVQYLYMDKLVQEKHIQWYDNKKRTNKVSINKLSHNVKKNKKQIQSFNYKQECTIFLLFVLLFKFLCDSHIARVHIEGKCIVTPSTYDCWGCWDCWDSCH